MARVEWSVLCDLGYFDAYRHLCLIGVRTEPALPTLSAGTHRFAIAARLLGLCPQPAVAVSASMPDGRPSGTRWCERIEVETAGDYLLVRLAGVPLALEGIYRFEVSVNGEEAFDMPVLVGPHHSHSAFHADEGHAVPSDSSLSHRDRNHAGLV